MRIGSGHVQEESAVSIMETVVLTDMTSCRVSSSTNFCVAKTRTDLLLVLLLGVVFLLYVAAWPLQQR